MVHEFEVGAEEGGQRLDVVLCRRFPSISRQRARDLIAAGAVRVDGRLTRKGASLAAGQRVRLDALEPDAPAAARPDPSLKLPIVFEDRDVVVVDKPAGVASHPLSRDELGTAASGLLATYPELATVGHDPLQPGIVHRLDRDTTGLLVAARSASAFAHLKADLLAGRWDKRYLAICDGAPEAGSRINLPIGSSGRSNRRARACHTPEEARRYRGQAAETEVLAVTQHGARSLVEVRVRSGRRHQVRVHLAAIGHPLVGDALYGGQASGAISRHALHAHFLGLDHPSGQGQTTLQAPLPDDMARLLDRHTDGA